MKKIENVQQLQKYKEYFKESDFWKKLSSVAKKLGRTPTYYALVLYYVLTSPNVSMKNKGIILGVLGYLIIPFDLIADFIPGVGLLDDVAALKLVYDAIKVSVTPDVVTEANNKLKQWFD